MSDISENCTSAVSFKSSHSILVRGVIISLTRKSSRANTFSIIICSRSSKTPCSRPCSIKTRTSSSVTGGSSLGLTPITLNRTVVDTLKKMVSGRKTVIKVLIKRAKNIAIFSGLFKASFFGSSSPKTRLKYVTSTTTVEYDTNAA